MPQKRRFELRDTCLEIGLPQFVVPQPLGHFFGFTYLLRPFASKRAASSTAENCVVGVFSYFNFSSGIFEGYMLSDKSLLIVKVKRRFLSLNFVAI